MGLITIYVGLGILGVCKGWTNTDTIFAKVMGSLFLINGISTIWVLIKKKTT
jgi:hypothetical protein